MIGSALLDNNEQLVLGWAGLTGGTTQAAQLSTSQGEQPTTTTDWALSAGTEDKQRAVNIIYLH